MTLKYKPVTHVLFDLDGLLMSKSFWPQKFTSSLLCLHSSSYCDLEDLFYIHKWHNLFIILDTESLYTIGTQNVLDKFFQNPRKLYSWDYKVILMGLKTEEVWKKIVEHFEIPITWQEYEKLAIEQFDVLMKDCEKLDGKDN